MTGHWSNYGKRSHSQPDYSESGGNKRRNSGSDKAHYLLGLMIQCTATCAPERRLEVLSEGERRCQATESRHKIEDQNWCLCQDVKNVLSLFIVLISGDASVVKKALYQIASRLHDNPSQSRHLLSSSVPTVYSSGSSVLGATAGAPIMGLTPLLQGMKRLQKNSHFVWSDCVISISAKAIFKGAFSPAFNAALRLQPRCSEKVERDSDEESHQGLYPVLSKENLPKVASKDDDVMA
ncbi:hypothetical protein Pfo_008951 [Paulownia fortunei]|nr:hypothetical protein Pfo_008951 [Paulownia fortunei]